MTPDTQQITNEELIKQLAEKAKNIEEQKTEEERKNFNIHKKLDSTQQNKWSDLGNTIETLRKHKQMKIKDLCSKTNLARTTLFYIRKYGTNNVWTLQRILETLDAELIIKTK